MHIVTMNIWGLNTLYTMLVNQQTTPKEMRRYNRVLDEIEPIQEEYHKYREENNVIKAKDIGSENHPMIKFALEDDDFDFLKKKHAEFKGYTVGARRLITHIDEAFENTEKKKVSVKDYKEGNKEDKAD